MFRKIVLIVAICVCFGLGVYFRYFRRPPTEDILAANLVLHGGGDDDDDEDVDGGGDGVAEDEDEVKSSARTWDRWIRRNRYISIGKLFNKCDGNDRIMVGRVIMLQDKVHGGVTSKTYLNVTLENDVTGGAMYITCQYNGNDLYSNHWDLCTVEEDMDDRIIFCPIRAGRKKFVKELKIPNYLPKGRYTTKAWLLDQENKPIGCAFAEFTL
jgi:hypothetical protein